MAAAAKRRSLAADMARLSVKLPNDTLQSSLEHSSPYFLEDRDTHVMAHSIKTWLSEEDTQLPTGHTSFNSDLQSLEKSFESDLKSLDKVAARPRLNSTVRSSMRDSVRGSILLGAVRYEDMVPGVAPRQGGEFEKLQREQSRYSQYNDAGIDTVSIREDGEVYATGMKLALIITALCFAVFVMALGMCLLQTPAD